MRLMRCGLVLAFACAGIVAATAQSPAGGVQPPHAASGRSTRRQPPAPGGRGGGRGRGAIQVMTLTSTAFADGAKIPAKYTQAGEEVSPPLAWSGAPEGTASFVVMMHDVDTAIAAGQRRHASLDAVEHSADGDELARARGRRLAARRRNAADQRHRSVLQGSGRALSSGPAHHYVFELFALDTMLEVPAVGASPPLTRAAIAAAMATHVRAKAALVGLFKRD